MVLASELKRKSIHLASLSIPIAYYLTPDSWIAHWETVAPRGGDPLAGDRGGPAPPSAESENIFRHFFGELLRNHEDARLLGSTYLLIACLLTIHLFPKPVAVLALSFLILGDTVAAIVGKSMGTIRLLGWKIARRQRRLLCGLLRPDVLPARDPVPVGLVGALIATVFELLPIPLDDNFRIPLSAGFAMELLLSLRVFHA